MYSSPFRSPRRSKSPSTTTFSSSPKFTNSPSVGRDRFSPSHRSPTRSSSSSSSSPHSPLSSSPRCSSSSRRLPNVESKILCAPDVYSTIPNQVISYSDSGVLAIALANKVYLYYDGDQRGLFESSSIIEGLCWWDDDLVISSGGKIEVWHTSREKSIVKFQNHRAIATALSAYKNYFATGGDDGIIYVYKRNCSQFVKISLPGAKVCAIAWSKEGDSMIVADSKKRILIYDTEFVQIGCITHDAAVVAIATLPGNYLVTGDLSKYGVMRMFSIKTGTEVRSVCTGSPISSIVWDDHWGLIVANVNSPSTWEIWEKTFQRIAKFRGHDKGIICMAYHSQSQQLATISCDETIQISSLTESYHTYVCPFKLDSTFR